MSEKIEIPFAVVREAMKAGLDTEMTHHSFEEAQEAAFKVIARWMREECANRFDVLVAEGGIPVSIRKHISSEIRLIGTVKS